MPYHKFFSLSAISTIWASFCKILGHVTDCLIWCFHDGGCIPIGTRQLRGISNQPGLSTGLIHQLNHRGIIYLSQIILYWTHHAPVIKSAEQLGLNGIYAEEWVQYQNTLRGAGFCHATGGDAIIWDGPLHGNSVIVKDIYQRINYNSYAVMHSSSFSQFWKLESQLRSLSSDGWYGRVKSLLGII